VRIAIQSRHNDEPFHLPHQGLWFVVLLLALVLLLSKTATGASAIGHRASSSICPALIV